MEIGGRRVRKATRIQEESSYPCTLQFYSAPPSGNISLMEFDEMATERLKILRTVERVNLSGQVKNSEEWMKKLYEDFAKNKYFIQKAEKTSVLQSKREEVESARRRDHVSHFILRLAYCRTEELRRWFISHETDLFRARFLHNCNNGADIKAFMTANNLHFMPISQEEVQSERENLINGTYNINSGALMEGKTFFKVPFTEALELVRHRRVFVKGGSAYVPDTDLVTLVTASFRANLSQALATTSRALPQLEDDERLLRLLQDFDKRYTGNEYNQRKGKGSDGPHITPDMIDLLATKSFPMCMRQLNDALRTTHHLKYGGRLVYGLFLKAAGLSLEDALYFWRSHFTKNMDVDKFEKQYAYGIRFNYGKEGKRTDWSPYSCIKIIMGNIGPGDAHGCPFKHSDPAVLRHRLNTYKLPQTAITEIMELSGKHHYQIACQKYWEASHGGATLDAGVNHPNQYFEESHKYLNIPSHTAAQGKKAGQIKGNRSVMYSSQSSTQSQPESQSSQSQSQQSTPTTDNDTTAADTTAADTTLADTTTEADMMDDDMLMQYMDTTEGNMA